LATPQQVPESHSLRRRDHTDVEGPKQRLPLIQ